MPGEFSFSSESEASGRVAVVADEGESVWLYLTEPGGQRIAADCWLFNRVPAPGADELEARAAAYRARGAPPPAARDVVDARALLPGPLHAHRVRLAWSANGESVAAWVDGALAGYVAAGEPRGYSAHLVRACPWGAPLDTGQLQRLFASAAREA